MKVLISGDRNWTDHETIRSWLVKLQDWGYDTVIHGGARGADRIAGEEAKKMGFTVVEVKAEWGRYGKHGGAGPVRNRKMLDMKPNLVVGFHPDIFTSKGTYNCLTEAQRRGIEIIIEDGR